MTFLALIGSVAVLLYAVAMVKNMLVLPEIIRRLREAHMGEVDPVATTIYMVLVEPLTAAEHLLYVGPLAFFSPYTPAMLDEMAQAMIEGAEIMEDDDEP